MILYETFQNFIEPKPVEQLDQGLFMVAVTAVVNYSAGYVCSKVGKKNNSLALQSTGRHLQIDTLSTLVILVTLIIMLFTQLLWLDKAVALILSIVVIYNGYKIIRKSLAGIMDEADMELLKQFVAVLNNNRRENWIDLHNLRVIKYGSIMHIDCHLTVPWYMNVIQAHKEVEELIALIKNEFGDIIEMFVHTDVSMDFLQHSTQNEFLQTLQELKPEKKREWTLENIISDKKHKM